MDTKKEIHSYIVDRVKNITNDSRTFLLVRTIHIADIKDAELDIGGGNLLIAMNSFSIFEYLSKIYYGLTNDIGKWFNDQKNWKYKMPVDDCFVNLVLDNQSGISFGIENLKPNELKILWNEWRNKLTHLLCQNEKHCSISFLTSAVGIVNQRQNYLDFIHSKIINQCAFVKNKESWQCFVDILNRDLDKLANWIANDILNKAKEENVEKIYVWLTSNLQK